MDGAGAAARAGEETSTKEGFNELVGELDYPMFIVTTRNGEQLGGCLVGFATQCSIDPPRFLVCLSDKNRTTRLAQHADAVAVHFVPASADPLAQLFGGQTGDDVDKFAQCNWHQGPLGLPILDECDNWFAATILARQPVGDHIAVLLDPFEAYTGIPLDEFTFHRARRIDAGHEA
jgi:flavin reductase (DIM6/NTAB) family NADH-FMN oxidoreductase RutF